MWLIGDDIMVTLKTICLDKYGSKTNDELKQFIKKYDDKIHKLTKEFVNESVDQNIEHNSAYGMFLSITMGNLSSAYFDRCVRDLPVVHLDEV